MRNSTCGPRRPKRLGQRFLRDRGLAARIAKSFCRKPMVVYEIGPGSGIFTRFLAEKCMVVGAEIDPGLAYCLQAELGVHEASLTLVVADALKPPLNPSRIDAVFGSIPYNITGPLLAVLVKYFQKPALLVLQREVAERLAAKPGSPSYGRITVLVNMVYDVVLGEIIPPHKFIPPPKVYSRIVLLQPRRRIRTDFLECVEKLTSCLFSQRRKLASKIIRKCTGLDPWEVVPGLGDKRVYELAIEEVEEIAEKTCNT